MSFAFSFPGLLSKETEAAEEEAVLALRRRDAENSEETALAFASPFAKLLSASLRLCARMSFVFSFPGLLSKEAEAAQEEKAVLALRRRDAENSEETAFVFACHVVTFLPASLRLCARMVFFFPLAEAGLAARRSDARTEVW